MKQRKDRQILKHDCCRIAVTVDWQLWLNSGPTEQQRFGELVIVLGLLKSINVHPA